MRSAREAEEREKQSARARIQREISESQLRIREDIPGKRQRRPFDSLLEQASVTLTENSVEKSKITNTHAELTRNQAEARQDTLKIASAAAEALAMRIDPTVGILVNTGTAITKKMRVPHTYRRKVMRGGRQINEEVTKQKLLGKENIEQYSVLDYGWEIPLNREFNEPGARAVLCKDGKIMTLRAHERPASDIKNMYFNPGSEVTDKGFMAKSRDQQPPKIVLVTNHTGYSELTHEQSSDIAAKPLPTNNPEGADQMTLRREMSIQEGLAKLLSDNGVIE